MALTKIDDRGLKTPIDLLDNEKIRFGTGNDLEIFHSGSHSFIKDTGTGALVLNTDTLWLNDETDTETYLKATKNGAVEIRYDTVKKFETTSTGASVTGELDVSGNIDLNSDTAKIFIGDGNDLQIYHDGSHSYLNNYGGSLRFSDAGSEKFRISGTGTSFNDDIFLSNDNDKINIGAGNDLQIYHNGSNSYISNNTGWLQLRANNLEFVNYANDEYKARFVDNSAVELYYDGSKKFETKSDGVTLTGNLYQQTTGNVSLLIGSTDAGGASIYLDGDSNGDWSGSDYGYIKHNTSGNLEIGSSNPAGTGNIELKVANTEYAINAVANGAVSLYHDGSKKFETTTAGIEIISTGNTPQIDYYGASNNALGRIDCDAISGTTSNMRFFVETGGSIAEKLRIQTGGGISFNGDTAAANALDDYEEGTWTPTIYGGTTAGSYSYEAARTGGKYTKIGNMVYIEGVVRISAINTAGAGDLYIGGLPKTVSGPMASAWTIGRGVQVFMYGTASNSTATNNPPPFVGIATGGASAFNIRSYGKNYNVMPQIEDLSAVNWIYQIAGWYPNS